MKTKEELYQQLSDAVVDMDEDAAIELANEVVEDQYDAYEAIEKGLSDGMERAGELFEDEEYFIPELLMCSDAMTSGIDVLVPHIKKDETQEEKTVVLGVVQGDTHDIGKNLVKIMLEASGFKVIDLGRDIPAENFIDEAVKANADIIALSTLMTTTMKVMDQVVQLLRKNGLRGRFKVMIGGGPISQKFADQIGADGYSVNATEAVRLAKRLTSGEPVIERIAV